MIDLTKLTENELRELNRNINHEFKRRAANAVYSFRPGDRVEFQDRSGTRIEGTVHKINRTTVIVKPLTGFVNWKISPSLLKKI